MLVEGIAADATTAASSDCFETRTTSPSASIEKRELLITAGILLSPAKLSGSNCVLLLLKINSPIPCPYLVHHRPKRITKDMRENRLHPFAVAVDYLTRAYSAIRDEVGVYNHLPKIERPGFHSIRALGVWLYAKAGYSDEYIIALAGHANEKMKAHYAEGHEKPKPIKVSAGLSLSNVDLSQINWETDLSKPLKIIIDSSEA